MSANSLLTFLCQTNSPSQTPVHPSPPHPVLFLPAGMLTFLRTDGEPGLQICTDGATWRDVPPVPGAFIVNLGDMLCRWAQECAFSRRFPACTCDSRCLATCAAHPLLHCTLHSTNVCTK